ncbi:MAG TPA: hypothetical protein VJ746_18385 [Nitrospira sp.]|nr:hypothetical protein [Nitrospira sp.]
MSGTWDPVKLAWIAAGCLLASGLCLLNAWGLFKEESRQRTFTDHWSSAAIVLWWVPVLLGLLVFYPLPYFNHHIDKFIVSLAAVVAWNVWMLAHPTSLNRFLHTRAFVWIRTMFINGLIVLLVGEAAMRLADPILAKAGLFLSSSDTPGGGIPFQITDPTGMRTNSRGFRDRERSLTRGSSVLRIVALGDSFAWGSGATYDEAFLTLLEGRLQTEHAGAEVINLGLIGYQPEEYLALLKSHGLAYDPDVVLVNFFVGNDFMPAQGEHIVVAGHRHRVHVDGNWFHDHLSWDHWYLSHDLRYAILLAQATFKRATGETELGMFAAPSNGNETGRTPAAWSGWSPRYLQMIQGMGDQYLKQGSPAFAERWEATRDVLDRIDALLRERSIPWTLILLPAEEQVDHELQRLYVQTRKGDAEDYDFGKPQQLLLEWGKVHDVPVIDLAPAFRSEARRRHLYVENDIHWNHEGNALAAEVIFDALRPLTAGPLAAQR